MVSLAKEIGDSLSVCFRDKKLLDIKTESTWKKNAEVLHVGPPGLNIDVVLVYDQKPVNFLS